MLLDDRHVVVPATRNEVMSEYVAAGTRRRCLQSADRPAARHTSGSSLSPDAPQCGVSQKLRGRDDASAATPRYAGRRACVCVYVASRHDILGRLQAEQSKAAASSNSIHLLASFVHNLNFGSANPCICMLRRLLLLLADFVICRWFLEKEILASLSMRFTVKNSGRASVVCLSNGGVKEAVIKELAGLLKLARACLILLVVS